jgi:hypothetical protein
MSAAVREARENLVNSLVAGGATASDVNAAKAAATDPNLTPERRATTQKHPHLPSYTSERSSGDE